MTRRCGPGLSTTREVIAAISSARAAKPRSEKHRTAKPTITRNWCKTDARYAGTGADDAELAACRACAETAAATLPDPYLHHHSTTGRAVHKRPSPGMRFPRYSRYPNLSIGNMLLAGAQSRTQVVRKTKRFAGIHDKHSTR